MSSQASPSLGQPRKSAMKREESPEQSPVLKAVRISEPDMSQLQPPQTSQQPPSPDDAACKKQYPAGVARRLSGRLAKSSPRSSPLSHGSLEVPSSTGSLTASPSQTADDSSPHQILPLHHLHHTQHHHLRHAHHADHTSQRLGELTTQVDEWLQRQKAKREGGKACHKSKSPLQQPQEQQIASSRPRADSIDSASSEVSLDRLQRIIDDSKAALGLSTPGSGPRTPSGRPKRNRSSLQLNRSVSSDTEYADGDVVVPSCDVILDNSKTMSYSGGTAQPLSPGLEDSTTSLTHSKREEKERQAWVTFKNEIIKLAHTLKLKGWRQVPLDSGDKISVSRLSGALTNAVYVVSPPADLPNASTPIASPELMAKGTGGNASNDPSAPAHHKKPPPKKVLLRIYGPNVDQLINRDRELSVLKRLSRKKIGPRLLGTFTNGRFEQFINSTTLTPPSLREPETSKQIAKRMRELHSGMDLLEEERDNGPNVWANWDKWVDIAEEKATLLDSVILSGDPGPVRGPGDAWKTRGFVCGVEWRVFRALVDKYRQSLNERYGDPKNIREKLVFAHNDTQYGNILRVRPDDEKSPLLQPANEHKQLVVIDFEYAAANLPGLEFANHFTEWAYNYHDPAKPWACDVARYPTPDQQYRFVRSYVEHNRLQKTTSWPSTSSNAGTPTSGANAPVDPAGHTDTPPSLHPAASSSSIADFMLDARAPPGGWNVEDKRHDEMIDTRVRELLEETRLWRPANSAMWIAWGIVQAKVPEVAKVDAAAAAASGEANGAGDDSALAATTAGVEVVEDEEDSDEFDYLSYSHDRALWFLGDCVLMGLVDLEDLPEKTREDVKLVDY